MGCFLIPIPFYLLFSKSIQKCFFPTLVFYFIPKLWYMPLCSFLSSWADIMLKMFFFSASNLYKKQRFLASCREVLFLSLNYQIQLHELKCAKKMLQASLLGSWEYLQKRKKERKKAKQKECQGSRLWDQGITLLIKIQVALLPMGIQCNTLDWIR